MSTPAVSIVTPTYNSLALLQECLDSVFNQTLPQSEIEIIVVDDGSTDGTWDYLQSLREEHPNLTALRQENSGRPSVGRNRGMAAATGEFIFFLDSDDWFSPEALERMVSAAREHGSDVVLGLAVGDNRTVRQSSYLATVYDADLLEDGAWRTLSPWKLFRTSLVRRLGAGFPEDMVQGEDQVFVAQCYFAARKVSILADYDYYHLRGRTDGQNVSKQPQSLRNKLLTTSRTAAIINANTKPGSRRQGFFHRVIFRTLAPGLGRPFMEASAEEQEDFLRTVQQEVLPNMRTKDLAAAADKPRLRLAVARSGTAAQLVELNQRLADGPGYSGEAGTLHFDLGPELNALVPAELRQVQDAAKLQPAFEGVACTPEGPAVTYRLDSDLFSIPGLGLMPPELEFTGRGASAAAVSITGRPKGDSRWEFVYGPELLAQVSAEAVVWNARVVLSDKTRKLASGRAPYPRAARSEARGAVMLAPDSSPVYLEAYSTAGGNFSVRQGPKPRFTAVKVEANSGGQLELSLPRNAGAVRGAALQMPANRLPLEHALQPDGRLVLQLPAPGDLQIPSPGAAMVLPAYVLDIDCEHAGCQLPLRRAADALVPLKRPAAAKAAPDAAAAKPAAATRPAGKQAGLAGLLKRIRRRLRRHARLR